MNDVVVTYSSVEVVETPVVHEIIVVDQSVDVVAVAEQGPPGPPGPQGPAGATTIAFTAPASLGGLRVLTANLVYADSGNSLHINKVIGFTTGAASAGQPLFIQTSGELDGFSSLTIGPVYLGANGVVTQIPPTTGFIQQVGVATSSTTILINISSPIAQV